jgi:hypothetical protein
MLNKFSQIAGGTLIDENGNPLIFDYSKANYIKDNYSDKRIAIYYRYKAEFTLLASYFPNHTTDWTTFESENDYNCPVFLSQIQSGREGISLRSADLIIMYNIDFSATSYWQVRARMQHKNRVGNCPIHWLMSDLGIEAKVYKAVSTKKNFTVSYYKKYGREKGAISGKKEIDRGGLFGSQDNVVQPSGMARPTSAQERQNNIYRVQSTGKETNATTSIQAREPSCDWL